MARSIPETSTTTHLRAAFNDLLEGLDHGGFNLAGAHVDLARHAFERELAIDPLAAPDGLGPITAFGTPLSKPAKALD